LAFIVELFNIVEPGTFNDDMNVALLLNIDFELTFNMPLIVVSFSRVKSEIFNDDANVALSTIEFPDTFKSTVFKFENQSIH
jgi:hypothetical protein